MIHDPFGWEHARITDPDTSRDAVPVNLSDQAYRVLRAYRTGLELLDHDAYRLVGMDNGGRMAHQRCSDLRKAGMIERTGRRGQTPSGKAGYVCRITPRGLAYLEAGRPDVG